ncbi:MAG: hypothetical protein Q8N35_02270 [Methylococcaceae bacterium]|nr:hypothetical protein [Methylococcaceae bacterium]MDZ4156805.1 hypothetical protein [Methylococcales bacterium]MDP2391715.1 hypothetical protein [Methylococcaceae bacterium]MDP3018389.1 hypothetical protein [Methylococcaceae bacterium]MDP3389301.1 hypothetical protein [Methylococcaceae bacterium]
MKKINKSPLAAAMGAAFISTLAASPANAETNPFGLSELSSGYMQVAAAEMACGANMDMTKSKAPEGACAGKPTKAADKPTAAAAAKPAAEGSCGEGMCGAMMQGDKMKPGMEASCGAMMKGKEGACGATGKDEAKATPSAASGHDAHAAESKPTDKPAAKTTEGSCGEGMCGAMMQGDKMKSGMEHSCGAMMKGKDGACGASAGTKDDGQTKISPAQAAGKTDEHHDKYGLDKSLIKVVPYVPKK